jgi:hypothetical protein
VPAESGPDVVTLPVGATSTVVVVPAVAVNVTGPAPPLEFSWSVNEGDVVVVVVPDNGVVCVIETAFTVRENDQTPEPPNVSAIVPDTA